MYGWVSLCRSSIQRSFLRRSDPYSTPEKVCSFEAIERALLFARLSRYIKLIETMRQGEGPTLLSLSSFPLLLLLPRSTLLVSFSPRIDKVPANGRMRARKTCEGEWAWYGPTWINERQRCGNSKDRSICPFFSGLSLSLSISRSLNLSRNFSEKYQI